MTLAVAAKDGGVTSAGAPATTIRVLMVEDSPDDAELILRELKRCGLEVTASRVETASAMRERLTTGAWDVVLSDFSLPQFSAPAALGVTQQLGLDIPFIVVSGTIDEEDAVAALKAGAHDFITKSRLARLAPAIEREVREARGRAEQRQLREQLFVSDRMATIGVLAAGVAHELSNPLCAVIAGCEFLDREIRNLGAHPATADLLEAVTDTRDAAERVGKIAADIRVFSRSESEPAHPVDVHAVLDSALKMAAPQIKSRAQVVKEYAGAPLVMATESRLGQVFLNLIVNAAQAIPTGRKHNNRIRISTTSDEEGRAVVVVADTGEGIAAEAMDKLFSPFYTTKPQGVGTGLGLSICRRIVREFGGDIGVTSRLGAGSEFRVTLPAAPARAPRTNGTSERLPSPPEASPRRGRVLVIDDDGAVSEAIRRVLASLHDVAVATNGREGFDLLSHDDRFDVILCDLLMPEMSGMEFFERLSRDLSHLTARVVFLAGHVAAPELRRFVSSAKNPIIEKPFSPNSLRSLVARLVA